MDNAKTCFAESRHIFLTIFLFSMFASVSEMVTPPHIRTFVPCANQSGGGGGEPLPFSGSKYCDDKKLVVQTVTQITARNQAIMGALAVVATPVLGALSDRRGRVPILGLAVLGRLVILLILSFHSGYFVLLSVNAVISGCTTMFNAIFNTMLGDQGGDRSVAFTLKMMVGQAGGGLGLVVGVGLLRLELLDYTYVFLAFIGLYLLFAASAAALPETLPAKTSAEGAAADPGPGKINLEAIFGTPLLLMRDPALAYLLCAELLGSISGSILFNTMPSFAMTAYDWRQGIFEAVAPCLTMPPAALAVFAPKLIHKFGTERFLELTGLVCCIAMTMVIFAPLGPVFGLAPLAILAGTSGRYTALNTFYAERYRDDCGKIQSASQTLGAVAIAAGGAITGLTYNAKATTMVGQSTPFIVVAVLVWTSSIFFFRAMHLQRRAAAAAGEGAAGPGGKKEE